jgi:uncharacterized membrane protein
MDKTRLEAFSDGVIAILITIMVLELKTPADPTWEGLRPLRPVFLAYVLSFVYLGIYWANHHHTFKAVDKVNGRILWANTHLLFWLSLTPFATARLGATSKASCRLCFTWRRSDCPLSTCGWRTGCMCWWR